MLTKNNNDLKFAWTSKKMLLTSPAFFRMSLRVTKPGFTPKTRKPKFNPVNGKVRGHLDRRRQGKREATSSKCWFSSLIRRELFTKNLFPLVKQLMLHSTSKFWNVVCNAAFLTESTETSIYGMIMQLNIVKNDVVQYYEVQYDRWVSIYCKKKETPLSG